MLKEQSKLQDIRDSWETVRIVQAMVQANLRLGIMGPIPNTDEFKNLAHSLVLLFAFSVLQDTLQQLCDENEFTSRSRKLGALMENSKNVLPWVNYDKVDKGRDRRNDVAHERKFLPRRECVEYIDAIEDELVAWMVLPRKLQKRFTIEVGLGQPPTQSD